MAATQIIIRLNYLFARELILFYRRLRVLKSLWFGNSTLNNYRKRGYILCDQARFWSLRLDSPSLSLSPEFLVQCAEDYAAGLLQRKAVHMGGREEGLEGTVERRVEKSRGFRIGPCLCLSFRIRDLYGRPTGNRPERYAAWNRFSNISTPRKKSAFSNSTMTNHTWRLTDF